MISVTTTNANGTEETVRSTGINLGETALPKFPAGICLIMDVVIGSVTTLAASLTALNASRPPSRPASMSCSSLLFIALLMIYAMSNNTRPLCVVYFFRYDKYCADHYGNNHCDLSCNTEACGWDGLDCSDTPAKLANGTLIIVVRLQPEELLGDITGFLRALGALLHTNLKVKLDSNNQPMLYPYYKEQEEGGRNVKSNRSKRELEKEVIG